MGEVVNFKDYYNKRISRLYIGDNLSLIDRISDRDLYIINSLELWIENEARLKKNSKKSAKNKQNNEK